MVQQTAIDPEPTTTDERVHPRYEGRLDAELLVDGARWRCWIRDISVGGAGVEPPIPAALGRDVVLISPGLGIDGDGLTGRVVNLAHRRTCIAFSLTPEANQRLGTFLAANATG
jgi:hypothetical protein